MKRYWVLLMIVAVGVSLAAANTFNYAPPGLTSEIPTPEAKPPVTPPATDDWQVMESFAVDITGPTGLTYDGEYFWVTNYTSSSNSCIYYVDPDNGQIMGFIPSPDYWPCGITYDGEYLWVHDFVVGHSSYPTIMSMCKVDPATGNVLEMLESTYTYFSGGVAWDGQYLYYGVRGGSGLPCTCYIYRLDPTTGDNELLIDLGSGGIYGLTYHDNHLYYSDPYNLMLYKIDMSGNVVDQSLAPGSEPAGLTFEDAMLCNVDNEDQMIYKMLVAAPDLDVTLTPHDPPITIPSSGGTFYFDVTIENTTSSAITGDAWIEVTPPGGSATPLVIRSGLTFPANTTISRTDLMQSVPGGAPAGVYTYTCSVGEIFVSTTDYDQFTFEKLSDDGSPSQVFEWNLDGWEETEISTIATPDVFNMAGAYPNPFNPTTTLSYNLPEAQKISLQVFDINGNLVSTLVNGWRSAGTHQVTFDASGLASGVYLYRLTSAKHLANGKMILMK